MTKKTCFVITPLGEDGSTIRKKTDSVIENVIRPALVDDYNIVLPHRINITGNITRQIISKIINVDLVIANLTGLNPNVMLELGIRFSFGGAVIIIAEKGTKLPFDISHERTIFYENSLSGYEPFGYQLKEMILAIDPTNKAQGIVYDAIGQTSRVEQIIENSRKISDGNANSLIYLLEQIENIQQQITLLSSSHDDFKEWTLGNRKYAYMLLPKVPATTINEFDEIVDKFERGLGSAIRNADYAVLAEPSMNRIGDIHILSGENILCQAILISVKFDSDKNLPTIVNFKYGLEPYADNCGLKIIPNGSSL
ncbi:MAG: hypothetical protein LBO70_02600 [Clostridiales Family XIII bacterium]|nr:hypothetical protein [Clostridiales Family XIII bacterium]